MQSMVALLKKKNVDAARNQFVLASSVYLKCCEVRSFVGSEG